MRNTINSKTKTKLISIFAFLALIALTFSLVTSNLGQIAQASSPLPSSTPIAGTDLNYRNSWFANTFSGINDKAVLHSVDAIAVDPSTGSLYTNTFWEEGGMQISQFKDGQKLKHMRDTAGWGRSGGQAIAVNSTYVFGAISIGGDDACANSVVLNENGLLDNRLCGTNWITIARYKNTLVDGNAGDSEFAPFPTGYGRDESYLIINNQNDQTTTTCAISGAYATETELFIGDYCNDKIQVFDTETMSFKRDFSVPNPGKMTMDKQGNLWILSLKEEVSNNTVGDFKYTYTDTEKILNYTATGTKLIPELFGPEITNTRGLAVNSRNDLLVAIGGEPNKPNAKQQIYFYNNIQTTPTYYKALGTENGYYGGAVKGEVRDGKFDWITGLAVDNADNIYISMQKIGVASYKEDGTKNWQVEGLLFLDSTANDPRNPNIYYSKWDKFEFDPNRPDGSNWKHLAKIYDFKQYPGDIRNWFAGRAFDALPMRVCYVNDTKFLVVKAFAGVAGYRFDKTTQGEIAIPAFEIHPTDNTEPETYIWTDANGDGTVQANEKVVETGEINYSHGVAVDEDCSIWFAQNGKKNVEDNITYYTPTALNAGGFSPNYSPTNKTVYKTPNEVTSQEILEPVFSTVGGTLKKLQYDKTNDVMYISGFPDVNEMNTNTGDPRSVGSKLHRYNNWSNPSTRTLAWTVDIAQTFAGDTRNSTNLTLAGDYIVVSEMIGDYGLFIYDKNTGQRSYLSSTVQGNYGLGWVDIPFGGVLLNYRSDGTYVATVEDDHYSKSFTYHFKPSSHNSVITGQFYFDSNGNNTLDSGENGENLPAGTRIKLTSSTNNNIIFYPIINTSGDYAQSLPAGTYNIEYILPSGYAVDGLSPNSVVTTANTVNNTDSTPVGISVASTGGLTPLVSAEIPNIEFNCNSTNFNSSTSCSFTLPANKTLPNDFKISIGNQASFGNQICSISGNQATCSNIPAPNSVGNLQVFANIGGVKTDTGETVKIIGASLGSVTWVFTPDQGGLSPLFKSNDTTNVRITNFKSVYDQNPASNNYVCTLEYRNLADQNSSNTTWTQSTINPVNYDPITGCSFNITKAQRGNTLNQSLRLKITKTNGGILSTNPEDINTFYSEYLYRFQGAGVAVGM
jgi:hypothetical protein